MLKEIFETITTYFAELFASYKTESNNSSMTSKTITKGGFYTTIHENLKDTED